MSIMTKNYDDSDGDSNDIERQSEGILGLSAR